MVNPQLKDGYTPIANEILEALVKIRIPGEARQCLDFIIRKTYGYQKKEDWIALSQFVEATSLKKPTVSRALRKLSKMNIIIKKDNGIGVTYGLQKDCDKWEPLSKKITVIKKDNKGSTKKIIGGSTKKIPTKDIYYKRNITKETEDIILREITDYFCDKFLEEKGGEYCFETKDGVLFAKMMKMRGGKKRTVEDMKRLIDLFFASDDEFIQKAGFTVGIMKTKFNMLLSQGKKQDKSKAGLNAWIESSKNE